MDERAVPRWNIRTGTDGGTRTSSPSLVACSRRSCSRTWWTRPVGCASSVTGAGPTCCGRTTPGSAMRLGLFGGREVDAAGDGFLAAFDVPTHAVAFACAFHEGRRRPRPRGPHGRPHGRVRARGRQAPRRRGPRRRSPGEPGAPGEVLVSSTVRDVVAGSGLRFVDRGLHELRGVPGQRRLFAARRDESGGLHRGAPGTTAGGGGCHAPPAPGTAREHGRRGMMGSRVGISGPRAYPSRAPRNSSV